MSNNTIKFFLNTACVATILSFTFADVIHAKSRVRFSKFYHRPYVEVRKELIALGYRPFKGRHWQTQDACPGLARCSDYPELVYCSGTGIAICESAFVYRKNNFYIKVFSYGEIKKKVDQISPATRLDVAHWNSRIP